MKFDKLLSAAAISTFVLLGASHAVAADKLTMTMNWRADSAHLGFALAKTKGYYEAEGLDVTLQEGRGSGVAAQLVATGQSELGYADAGAVLNIAAKGAPIKIISTIWKAGQFGINFLEKSGIKTPTDLVGKKISVPPGSAMVPLVPMFLKANGIKESDVTIVSAAQNASLGLLTKGEVDAVAETPENIAVPLAAQGIKAGHIYFYDHGVPLISLSLVAREDKIKENPNLYKRFLRATLKGWEEAMKDPKAAVAALKQVFPGSDKTTEALMISAPYSFASVCPAGKGDKIGITDAKGWEDTFKIMTTAMKFPTTHPITAYYTNDLLPEKPVLCP
jgi:NitT/TauT family transport system substrate-binding protein